MTESPDELGSTPASGNGVSPLLAFPPCQVVALICFACIAVGAVLIGSLSATVHSKTARLTTIGR